MGPEAVPARFMEQRPPWRIWAAAELRRLDRAARLDAARAPRRWQGIPDRSQEPCRRCSTDASALRAFTRHCHDAFFRAILSDSERANALIHAHWPKALRWMLEGEPARPIDPALVHADLRKIREDKVYLVGGTLDQPNAVAPIEHISSLSPDTPGQVAASLRGLQAPFAGKETPWAIPFIFSTRRLSWNLPGAIDETRSAADIVRQLTWAEQYFARVTRRIPYEELSQEPVSRAMVGMMNIACHTPYPVDELRRIWSTDLARCRIVARQSG